MTFRIAIQDQGAPFAWGDTFDGVDEARAAVPGAVEEFPGAVVDVQELVERNTRTVWQSVDAPQRRAGFWTRLLGR